MFRYPLRFLYVLPIGSFLLLLFAITSNSVFAAEHQPPAPKVYVSRAELLDIAKELHPPGCTDSMTADYCTLATAYDLRAEIWDMLAQGKKKEQIIDELVAKYGERILAAPKLQGFNWLAWLLPGAGIMAGGMTIGWFVRSWVRRTAAVRVSGQTAQDAVSPQPVSPEQTKRVEEELKRWL